MKIKKVLPTHYEAGIPDNTKTVVEGYALGREYIDTNTNIKYYHKADGVWVLSISNSTALLQFSSYTSFPSIGDATLLYLDKSTRLLYYWDTTSLAYIKEGSFTSDFTVYLDQSSGFKTFMKWKNTELVPAANKHPTELLLLGAIEAIPPTVTLTSSSTIGFNQTAISNALSFTKSVNLPATSIASVLLEWKRSNESVWIELTTNTALTSLNHTFTDTTFNTNAVNYRYTVIDNVDGTTIKTLNITPTNYVTPSANLILTPTTTLTLGKMLRSLSTTFSNVISGTITRNSPYVNLSQYKIQRSYNNSIWADLIALTTITSTGGTLASNGGNITDNVQPVGQNNIYVRAFVVDEYNTPSGVSVATTASFGIYQPVFFGMSSAATPASVLLSGLTPVPIGSSSTLGKCNYQNAAADKTISGLSFTASTNKFCVAFDTDYLTLSTFFDTGSNLNLISNFTSSTQTVNFADGTSKTYIVYLYNLVVSSGTYVINIS